MLLVRGQGELWVQPGCQQLSRSKIKTPVSRWGFLQLGGPFLCSASLLFVCLALLYLCINGGLVALAPVFGRVWGPAASPVCSSSRRWSCRGDISCQV